MECNKIFSTLSKANTHMALHVGTSEEQQASNDKNVILKQPLYETGNGTS